MQKLQRLWGSVRIVQSSEVLEEQETSPERSSKREDIDVPRGKGKLLPCRLLLLLSAPFLLLLSALELSLARPSSLNLSSTLCFSLSPGLNKLPSPFYLCYDYDSQMLSFIALTSVPLVSQSKLQNLWYMSYKK